jgi:Tfp pilus assembly protein PilO
MDKPIKKEGSDTQVTDVAQVQPLAAESKLNLDSTPITKKIVTVSLILSLVAVVGTVSMGKGALKTNQDIKTDEYYVSIAKDVQPNFEDSLSLYTGDTQKVIDYLLDVRPDNEEDYITFLAKLEELGSDLSLKLDISSHEADRLQPGAVPEPSTSLDYEISFYGSFRDLESFLVELENLPYYIKISEINFVDLNGDGDDKKKVPNLNIKIKLYIK